MQILTHPTTTELAKAIGEDYHAAKEARRLKRLPFNPTGVLKLIASNYLIHRPDLSTPEQLITIVSRIWRQNKKKPKKKVLKNRIIPQLILMF